MAERGRFGRARTAIALVPALVFVICSLSADLVAMAGRDPLGIWQFLPAGPVRGGWINAELSSTALLLIAIALLRAKRAGFWLALAALAGAFVVQGMLDHHRVAAGLAVATAVILVATRRRYDVRTGSRELVMAGGLLVVGALVAGVAAALDGPTRTETQRLAGTIGSWLDGGTMGRLGLLSAVAAALLLARLAFVGATALSLDPASDPRTAEELRAARLALHDLGQGSLLPYQQDDLVSPYAARRGDAVIAFARAGRTAVALGDPAGDPDATVRAFGEWSAQCRSLDWLPVVYQASATLAAVTIERGWHACGIGAEAIVDPTAFDISSPRLANLRHTVTRARKGGLSVVTSAGADGLGRSAGLERLAALDAEWRRRAGPSLQFTVGRFDPTRLHDALVVVASDPDGDPAAFVVLRPTGADGGWMLDVMRRRRETVPGAVESCLVAAIQLLSARGTRRLSLGLAPLAGLDVRHGPLVERALAVAANALRPVYDTSGLAFFKDKFGPTWEPRFILVPHPWSYPSAVVALLRLHLGGSWARVIRSLLRPAGPSPSGAV